MTQAENRSRWGAAVVAVAPAVLGIGLVAHPFLSNLEDRAAFAEAVASQPTRWAWAHLTVAVGSALLILAFIALHSYLREARADRWSGWALPLIVLGVALYTILPGMEFAPYAAAEIEADIQAAQESVIPWALPVLLTSGVLFAVGAYGFARAIVASGILSRGMAWTVASSLIVMAIARLIPLGAVQFYVQSLAALVALWPIAATMWGRPEPRMVGEPAPA